MKYTIELSGRGAEAFIFKLTGEQYQKLFDGDVESDSMSQDEICEILDVESYFDNDSYLGLFNGQNHGEYCWITVKNESEEIIWEFGEDFNFEQVDFIQDCNDGQYLVVLDKQKGTFFQYEIETESAFDPKLLSIKIVQLLGGREELITDIKYNGMKISDREYCDTSSSGYVYLLD